MCVFSSGTDTDVTIILSQKNKKFSHLSQHWMNCVCHWRQTGSRYFCQCYIQNSNGKMSVVSVSYAYVRNVYSSSNTRTHAIRTKFIHNLFRNIDIQKLDDEKS